jgi:hypothetical protein
MWVSKVAEECMGVSMDNVRGRERKKKMNELKVE